MLESKEGVCALTGGNSGIDSAQIRDFQEIISGKICTPLNIDFNHPFIDELHASFDKHLIGQEKAKKYLSETILHAILKIRDRKGPLAVLFFHGPTGVGKTETVKALAETLFGDSNGYIRVAGENYMESHSGSNLFGSPKGYIGHNEPTPITNKNIMLAYDVAKQMKKLNPIIKNLPWINIVLFDEVEKMHPLVRQQLLGMLDEGKVTLSNSEQVNFQNSIIIFTSNLGESFDSKKTMGFNESSDKKKDKENHFKACYKKEFSPEFRGRIHHMVGYESLTKDDCKEIINIQLKGLNDYLLKYYTESNIQIELSEDVYDEIIKEGYKEESGARDLVRTYYRLIETKVEIMLHSNEFSEFYDNPGKVIVIFSKKDGVIKPYISIEKGEKTKIKNKAESSTNVGANKISIDTVNEIFGAMSAYVELTYIHLDQDIDMRDELKEYADKLRKLGISHQDIKRLKNRAYLEGLRDLNFIDYFEGIQVTTDEYKLFGPYEPRTIQKIVERKLEALYKENNKSKKKFIRDGIEACFNMIETILNTDELSGHQANQILFYIRKTLVEKYGIMME